MDVKFWTTGVATGLTTLLTSLVVGLLPRLFPVRPTHEVGPPLTEEERRIYRRYEIGAIVPLIVLAALLGYGWYVALRDSAAVFQEPNRDTRFLIRPFPGFWAIPAIFLGLVSSGVSLECLYRLWLRDRHHRYERFCNERAGYEGKRVMVWMALLFATMSAIFFLVGVNSYVRFDATGVEIGRPLSFQGNFYKYRRVLSIEHRATFEAPNGNIIHRPHYVIQFDDGTFWNTDGLCAPAPGQDDEIARLVVRGSGRRIVEKP